jgi:hypothetical protein
MCEASRFASGNQTAEGSREIKKCQEKSVSKTVKQLRRHLLEDSSLLILFICLSALPYVASPGFYSDDWRFL